jgi:hypothetical protein
MDDIKPKRNFGENNPFAYELLPGEEILWMDRPDPRRIFSSEDILLIPFSLLWGGFAVFWNSMVWSMGAPFFFRLFGLPFLVIGLYLIVGRYIYRMWRKRHTYYAVTDQRVLILNTMFGGKLDALPVDRLPEMIKKGGYNGAVGTIMFGQFVQPISSYRRSRNSFPTDPFTSGHPGFYDIPNVNEVFAMLNDLQYKPDDNLFYDEKEAKRKRTYDQR